MKPFFESVVSYNKTFIAISCFLPIIIFLYILIVDKSNMSEIIVAMIILTIFCSSMMGIFYFLSKKFYEEYIIINNNEVIHRGPKLDGQKETKLQISELESILWVNETFVTYITSRNSIYFIDKSSNKHAIVKNKISAFFSINRESFNKISEALEIPIHKEFYIMSSDLKQRRKT